MFQAASCGRSSRRHRRCNRVSTGLRSSRELFPSAECPDGNRGVGEPQPMRMPRVASPSQLLVSKEREWSSVLSQIDKRFTHFDIAGPVGQWSNGSKRCRGGRCAALENERCERECFGPSWGGQSMYGSAHVGLRDLVQE